jgi:hypothetical protein
LDGLDPLIQLIHQGLPVMRHSLFVVFFFFFNFVLTNRTTWEQ